jgi:hypothetical protein
VKERKIWGSLLKAAIVDVLADVGGDVVGPIPTDTKDTVILLDKVGQDVDS